VARPRAAGRRGHVPPDLGGGRPFVRKRHAVETLDKKILAAALSVMAAEHTLDPALAQWAKELRLVGNLGGHFDPLDDVQMDEAEEMSRLARGLFTYLYEMPAKLARSRATGSTTQP
jgi:hypothetical protein